MPTDSNVSNQTSQSIRDLFRTTKILVIGDFLAKATSFILLPVYTRFIDPSSFGSVEYVQTILSMCYIFFSFQIIESCFRFVHDSDENYSKNTIITNSFFVIVFGVIIFSSLVFLTSLSSKNNLGFLYVLYVSSSMVSNLFLHSSRGLGYVKIYAFTGILNSILSMVITLILVVNYRMGSIVLLITPVLVNFFSAIFILVAGKIHQFIDVRSIDLKVLKSQLKYSLPLIPNALSIWLLASVGRIAIMYFRGPEETGILALSMRFPVIISTFTGIFLLAWQTNSLKAFSGAHYSEYFDKVLQNFVEYSIIFTSVFILAIKILIYLFISESYHQAIDYIPIFVLGVLFKDFSQFINTLFYGYKKTKYIFKSTLFASVIYVLLCLISAKSFGIYGISISYVISELIRFLYILSKAKRMQNISPFKKSITLPTVFILLSFLSYYLINDILIIIVIMILFSIVYVCVKFNEIKKVLVLIKEK